MRNLDFPMPVGSGHRPVREVALPVISNAPVNDEYRLMVLAGPRDLLAACRPGQFFHLLCPADSGDAAPYLRRPMSIYGADPERGELHFLYKVVGAGTRGLATLGAGDRLDVLGPLGNGFAIGEGRGRLVLVARGVGLATLAPLAAHARRLGRPLTAICSARTPSLLMSLDHFRGHGAEVIAVTDSDGSASMVNVEASIRAIAERDGVGALYTCGSARILALVRRLATEWSVPAEVALEQQMACGIGMCHACVRPFLRDGHRVNLRVCREGPVFPAGEVASWSI